MPLPAALPLFPLSNVVLFPRIRTPLHVFEPRYRQLTEHALAGARRIAMVVVRPEYVDAIAGDPPIFAIGCEGIIEDAKRLADGRYDILLQGTQRVRILREIERGTQRLYRVAEVERLDDAFESSARPRVLALRHRLLELAAELLGHASDAPPFAPDPFRDVDDATFVNALANGFPLAPTEKQGLLEAASIPVRYERLVELLSFLAAERNHLATPRSDAIH
jgi:Lon protease-like protein